MKSKKRNKLISKKHIIFSKKNEKKKHPVYILKKENSEKSTH